jgi:hypothetical protein
MNKKYYEDIFTNIHSTNFWGGEESKSGTGSDLKNTSNIIREIPILLKKYNIKSILDIPCGDFNWFKHINLDQITYTGADIVKNLVEQNNLKYKNNNVSFTHLDLITDTLPTVDLVLCRDCLFHLPTNEIIKSINNIKNSNSTYLLTTSYNWRGISNNSEINFGEWRRINLEIEPFNFPPPEYFIFEGSTRKTDFDRFLGLWKISNLPNLNYE